MKNKLAIMIISIFVFGVALAFAGGSTTVGPGNPASINCVKLGGELVLMESPAGQYANCVIDEWTLFNEMSVRGLVKPHHYEGLSMPNPAAVNCVDIGGAIEIHHSPLGEAGFCVVEEWALFRAIDVTREP